MPKTGSHLKLQNFGSHVQGVRLEGNRTNPEFDEFRVMFPGGDVSVTRCADGSYWAHVRCDHPEHGSFDPSSDKAAAITETRVDAIGQAVKPITDLRDVYHLAVRVKRA